ncbi:MAG: hypothetical protein ACRENZ_12200 [Thermodesulfobacteriota bacterium]
MRVVGGLIRNNIKDTIRPIKIPIPVYMKTNLGFEPDTYAYIFIPQEGKDKKREIILTQINPYDWQDLWKMTIVLKERIGIVSEILDFVVEKKFWSCITESVTTKSDNRHEITVIFKPEKSKKTEGSNKEKIASLKDELQNKSQNDIHGPWDYKISQMTFLSTLGEELEPERRKDRKLNNENYMGMVSNTGWVQIPVAYEEIVEKYFETTHKIFLYSDTEEKYIKYSFLPDTDTLFWFDINYTNMDFLIWCLRYFIKEKINILGSYSLPIRKKKRNKTYKTFGVYSIIVQLNDFLKNNRVSYSDLDGTNQIVEYLELYLKNFIHENLSKIKPQTQSEIQSGIKIFAKIYNPGPPHKFDYCPEYAF